MLETAYPPSKSIKKQYFFLFWQVSGPKESQMNANLQNLFHKKNSLFYLRVDQFIKLVSCHCYNLLAYLFYSLRHVANL